MMQGPVYFIGGTFGSSGSGWMIAIITAIVTAFATLGVGFWLEIGKRRMDRIALAASILAEIEATLQLFTELRMEETYQRVRAEMQRKLEASEPWAVISPDTLKFPVTIYEKCADRIGCLGGDVASDVVRFYNVLNGFRVGLHIALTSVDLPLTNRINGIDFVLGMLASERPKAETLRKKLQFIVHRPASVWRIIVS